MLIKKMLVYKMMGSNLFINYALPTMNMLYKVLGIKITNFFINKTAGEVFTSGEQISTLLQDIKQFEQRGILGTGNYVAEGLHVMDEKAI